MQLQIRSALLFSASKPSVYRRILYLLNGYGARFIDIMNQDGNMWVYSQP
jgi:hypothetical protein